MQHRRSEGAVRPRWSNSGIRRTGDSAALGAPVPLGGPQCGEKAGNVLSLGAVGMGSGADAPPVPMRAVPKKLTIRDVMKKDRLRMTPAAKKVLEEAYKPKGHRKLQVTGTEVLAQIVTLQPPDPAAVVLGALGVNSSEILDELASALAKPHQTEGRG